MPACARILSPTAPPRGSPNFTSATAWPAATSSCSAPATKPKRARRSRRFPADCKSAAASTPDNARGWLDAGASHVIVTSWVFREGRVDWERLGELVKAIGKNRLVLDLSCRKRGEDYFVVTDRWQKFTELAITPETLQKLAGSCAEFLIHAVDVEGLCRGIDRELVEKLGQWTPIPTTYAGGANSLADLEEVTRLGQGKIDLTIGSALDIFGGSGVKYEDCVKFNRRQRKKSGGG